ncbi:hypothetical protein Q3G72_018331 [Acer saccharum]|nr:hypothetical protein Q3G72_018331 [Acer saccharum]
MAGIGDVEDLYPIANTALQENLPETFGDRVVARGKDGGGTDGVGNGGEDSGGGLPMHTENQPVHSKRKRPRKSDKGRNEQFTTLVNASIRNLNTHLEAQFKSYLDELRKIDRRKDKEFTTQFKSYLDELREIDRRRDEQFMTLVNAISTLSNGPLPPCVLLLLYVNSAAKSDDGAPVHVSAEGTLPHIAKFFMSTSLDNSDFDDGDNGTLSATTKQSATATFSLELLLLCLYQFFGYSVHIPLELIRSLAAGRTPRKQLVYVSAVKSDDDTHVDTDHDLSSISKLSTSIGADSRLLNYPLVKTAANAFMFGEIV